MKNKYEVIFVLNNNVNQEDYVNNFREEFSNKLNNLDGKILKTEIIGNKQFVRTIKKLDFGFYIRFFIDLNPLSILNLSNSYKLDNRVIRLIFTKCDQKQFADYLLKFDKK